MKAVVAAFNQEKALVRAFSVITNLRMDLFDALVLTVWTVEVAGSGLTMASVGNTSHLISFLTVLHLLSPGWAGDAQHS